jgi:hypothetical protein
VVSSVVDRTASSRPSEIPEFNVWSEVPVDNSNSLPIKLIGRVVYVSKIAKSVVSAVVIKVVNHLRLLAVGKEPADTMGHVDAAFMLDSQVAISSVPPSNPAFGLARYVGQLTRARVIVDVFFNRVRDNLGSHIAPPCGLVRGLAVVAVSLPILSGCATERGNSRAAQHAQDQIKMVAIQREARLQEKQEEAATSTALVEALARVAEANPEHAPSVTVALAVIGVRGAGADSQDAPTVTLQREQNVGLEYAKALAPTVGNLVSGLGVAAINASVTKNAQDANREIMLGDQEQNARIVEAVAGLGTVASNNAGNTAGGDIYQVSDSGVIDQSINTSDSNNTTSTTTFSLSTTLNYDGSSMTLAELIEQLQDAGANYSIDLDGDGEPDIEGDGDGEDVAINCDAPQFSPNVDCT